MPAQVAPPALPRRPVEPIDLPDIEPAEIAGAPPRFSSARPQDLFVDEAYQRHLSESSRALIRRIVARWDWRRFKPPVVAETERGLEVIDGQHTAIAAASHPAIAEIPIMLVDAAELAARASAFIGHNRDRLGMTATQLHFAAVAAGDEDALTIAQVCDRAGVRIVRTKPPGSAWLPAETVAVSGIAALIGRRHARGARVVLQILAEARLTPINVKHIKAVELIVFDREFAGQVEPGQITAAIQRLGKKAEDEASVFAAAHNVQVWRALGITLFREARRRPRMAA